MQLHLLPHSYENDWPQLCKQEFSLPLLSRDQQNTAAYIFHDKGYEEAGDNNPKTFPILLISEVLIYVLLLHLGGTFVKFGFL
jgi:hypothetical protein